MNRIRVLVVDDAAAVRRLLTAALAHDPDLEVVGTAADGQIALSRLDESRPDVVVLDLEMPVMDGLQTLVALRKTHPRLPVIMFSRLTQRGVEATVHALTLGADDYVPKPGDGLELDECVVGLLIPKIKLLGRQARSHRDEVESVPATVRPPERPHPVSEAGMRRPPVEVIAIAASTGGPNALAELLPGFSHDWSIPILIVQHISADFTARLAERLAVKSGLRVREAVAGEPVSAAQVWLAAGGTHLLVERARGGVRLAFDDGPPVNSCRPAADVLFGSVAETYGGGVLAVVLTGMGKDGLRGCERIREAGGRILVQDEASSVVWSMPGAVAGAGLAEQVVPLERMGSEIVRRAHPHPIPARR